MAPVIKPTEQKKRAYRPPAVSTTAIAVPNLFCPTGTVPCGDEGLCLPAC